MLTPAATILSAASLPWPISVLHSSLDGIDNPWVVALEKAKQAGRILAMVMLMQYEVLHACDMDDIDELAKSGSAAGTGPGGGAGTGSSGVESAGVSVYRDQLHDMISNEQDIDSCMQFIQLVSSTYTNSDNDTDGDANGETNTNTKTTTSAKKTKQSPKKHRPITLVGYGIGARVIVHCLETLVSEYKMYSNKGYIRGLVEHVVLMGTPYGTNVSAWRELRNIVPGRFINCYSTHDWLLALMFRQCTWELGVAGLGPVIIDEDHVDHTVPHTTANTTDVNTNEAVSPSPGPVIPLPVPVPTPTPTPLHCNEFDVFHIENVDITPLIRSHADYPNALQLIIPLLRLES